LKIARKVGKDETGGVLGMVQIVMNGGRRWYGY
jgi:hypothetical protein